MQFPGKLMNQTSENYKKPNFWSDFGPFRPNLPCTISQMDETDFIGRGLTNVERPVYQE